MSKASSAAAEVAASAVMIGSGAGWMSARGGAISAGVLAHPHSAGASALAIS
jgi:hypothetical protein